MANAFVSSATGTVAAGAAVASSALSVTTGNAVLVAVKLGSAGGLTITGVADSASNTYAAATTLVDDGGGDLMQIWYKLNATGNAAMVVTATFSGSAFGTCAIHVHQVSGMALTSALDKTSVDNAEAGTAVDAPAITPDSDGQYIFMAAWGDSGTFTAGNSATERTEANELQTQSLVQTTAAAYTPTWTMSNTNAAICACASFRAAVAAGITAKRVIVRQAVKRSSYY